MSLYWKEEKEAEKIPFLLKKITNIAPSFWENGEDASLHRSKGVHEGEEMIRQASLEECSKFSRKKSTLWVESISH